MVKFGYTINYVESVNSALSFFEHAFDMQRRFITEEGDYGELETGETILAFASRALGESNIPGGFICAASSTRPLGVEIALVTDNVAAAHQQALQQGATELNPPAQKPWGQVVSYLQCPQGVLVELCSPISISTS